LLSEIQRAGNAANAPTNGLERHCNLSLGGTDHVVGQEGVDSRNGTLRPDDGEMDSGHLGARVGTPTDQSESHHGQDHMADDKGAAHVHLVSGQTGGDIYKTGGNVWGGDEDLAESNAEPHGAENGRGEEAHGVGSCSEEEQKASQQPNFPIFQSHQSSPEVHSFLEDFGSVFREPSSQSSQLVLF